MAEAAFWTSTMPEWVQAGAAIGTLIVAGLAALYAARQVAKARRLREEQARPYRFDRARIDRPDVRPPRIPVTAGQLEHEWAHLLRKVETRSPTHWQVIRVRRPEPHPIFAVEPGPVAPWERGASPA